MRRIDLKVQRMHTEWIAFGIAKLGRHVQVLVDRKIQRMDFPVPRMQVINRETALLGTHHASKMNDRGLGSRRNQG